MQGGLRNIEELFKVLSYLRRTPADCWALSVAQLRDTGVSC